ncbi:stimulated by retinoic acid 6 protein isoform X3 [Biomphalaria glabrata]|nr:putative stimulated by retinoic acid gene 6 protein isoform X3 [Biomphalaria glabrata]
MALLPRYIIHYLMLVPATLIIVLFSMLEKRKYRPDICGGRPACIIPIPLLDGYENRLAYAVALGSSINIIILVIFMPGNALGFEMSTWFKVLYILMQVLIACLLCLPFFICISTRHRAVGAVVNIFYCATWFGINLAECIEKNNLKELSAGMQAVIVLMALPNFVFLLSLIMYCTSMLYRCYKNKSFVHQYIAGTAKSHQVDHVRWVFKKSKDSVYQASLLKTQQKSFVGQMNTSRVLKFVAVLPFFKYPTKIVCIILVQLVATYMLSLLIISPFIWIKEIIDAKLLSNETKQASFFIDVNIVLRIPPNNSEEVKVIKSQIEIAENSSLVISIQVCYGFALAITILQTLFNIGMFVKNYRYHMLKLYQGDKHFIRDFTFSSCSNLASSVGCAGYLLIFTVWSFFLTLIAILLILSIGGLIIFRFLDNITSLVEKVAIILSVPILGLIFYYAMYFSAKFFLLHRKIHPSDKDLPLLVDNRKVFEFLNYLFLYFGMTSGIFSCLRRFIFSALFGYFALGRLDKSIYSRDLQKFDGAYGTYVAMLRVDNAHNNPSMRLFAHLLWSGVLVTRLRDSGGNNKEITHLTDTLNFYLQCM